VLTGATFFTLNINLKYLLLNLILNLNFFNMKKNMGSADKIIRLILAVLFAVLYFTGVVKGTLGVILLILAAVFIVTSLVSFCPLYTLFVWHSNKNKS